MDGKSEQDAADTPDSEIEREARKSRKELDSIPPLGTDPLHEGP